MIAALSIGDAGLLFVFFAYPGVCPWACHPHGPGFRGVWLDRPFFLARAVVYIALWLLFSAALVTNSRRPDQDAKLRTPSGSGSADENPSHARPLRAELLLGMIR
jgi:hypothetical protein